MAIRRSEGGGLLPLLADPSDIRSRPASVALGELAIAAGVGGESVTITSDFPANTLCQIWKYYTQTLGAGDVIHVRAKRDLKDFAQRIASVSAVFVCALVRTKMLLGRSKWRGLGR